MGRPIGVLALQGDYEMHRRALAGLRADVRWVRRPETRVVDPFGNPTGLAHMHPGHLSKEVIGPSGPVSSSLVTAEAFSARSFLLSSSRAGLSRSLKVFSLMTNTAGVPSPSRRA